MGFLEYIEKNDGVSFEALFYQHDTRLKRLEQLIESKSDSNLKSFTEFADENRGMLFERVFTKYVDTILVPHILGIKNGLV